MPMYLPPNWSKLKALQPRSEQHIPSLENLSLDAAGLIAIAEITVIAKRTALTGSSIYSDALVLCPGLHRQQNAVGLNSGEFPATAAITSGYVFRVENPAMVVYLQSVGVTGCLTTLEVLPLRSDAAEVLRPTTWARGLTRCVSGMTARDWISRITYAATIALSLALLAIWIWMEDWWGFACLLVLVVARLINVFVIRQRSIEGWKGASEPGVKGDLLVLMSGDCWIRMRGMVDDLKVVTAGKWLRKRTAVEEFLTALATLLVYVNTALVTNVSTFGQLLMLALLIVSAGLLHISNATLTSMHMNGRQVKIVGTPKAYGRRIELAEELIEESGRDDWAYGLGLIVEGSRNPANSSEKTPEKTSEEKSGEEESEKSVEKKPSQDGGRSSRRRPPPPAVL